MRRRRQAANKRTIPEITIALVSPAELVGRVMAVIKECSVIKVQDGMSRRL
jgi:hypothetical protein